MPREKPFVGQILHSLNIGNDARNCEQKLTEMVVTKIGRKYFTCVRNGDFAAYTETQYHLDDWREKTEYCKCSELFETAEKWEDKKEEEDIGKFIAESFEYGNNRHDVVLEDLRMIRSIIEAAKEE